MEKLHLEIVPPEYDSDIIPMHIYLLLHRWIFKKDYRMLGSTSAGGDSKYLKKIYQAFCVKVWWFL